MTTAQTGANVEIFARSPGVLEPEIVVTVPTFRRPRQILETLQSLIQQRTTRPFAVIVMENETNGGEGAHAAAPLFQDGSIDGLVLLAHDRGNCCAYNAGFETALAEFPGARAIAIIDDDELADPDWLEEMAACADRLAADIVGGPQIPIFADPEHEAWRTHPVFSPPYERTQKVEALYSSGNLYIRRGVLEAMPKPYLDLKFNFLGGGDSDFLSRARQKGFQLAWCAEAPVRETVPSRRLEADWIRARSLRNGVISTLVEKKKRAGERAGNLKVIAKSLALLCLSPLRGLRRYIATRSCSIGMYPIYVGLGRVLAEFGYMNEQYREPEKN
ncbi:glycosyltransferase family 2 protein [Nitratireductor basaltis]|uniref:Family 2 glycosyl transferase n=1 Tax=Nitratireductor basaltis TaxID=472175 RepID=A0A084UDV0_9HYPH|nr:glycosyltransferase [Nitratireductor basaltis]KFB11136.1 Family 2 glycosyl transferase [Nitratireductor basaltis]